MNKNTLSKIRELKLELRNLLSEKNQREGELRAARYQMQREFGFNSLKEAKKEKARLNREIKLITNEIDETEEKLDGLLEDLD